MDSQNKKIEEEIQDFNKTLLNLEKNDSRKIATIEKSTEKQNQEIGIEEFVEKNKWGVYKDLVDIFKVRTQNDNALKKKYSKILIRILISQLILMNVVFILKGVNILNFADTTFNIFITATIAEVFTLVTIIVKYLFTDKLTDLLGSLLSDNKNKKE